MTKNLPEGVSMTNAAQTDREGSREAPIPPEGGVLVDKLREGAAGLTPYCLGLEQEPCIDVSLPAYLNEAADLLSATPPMSPPLPLGEVTLTSGDGRFWVTVEYQCAEDMETADRLLQAPRRNPGPGETEYAVLRRVAPPISPRGVAMIARTPTEEMMQAGLYQAPHDAEWADVYSIWVDMWDRAVNPTAEPVPASLPTGSGEGLADLAKHTNWELSYGYPDEEADGEWQVHRVTGGRSDREWTLIGSGQTPALALSAALSSEAGS